MQPLSNILDHIPKRQFIRKRLFLIAKSATKVYDCTRQLIQESLSGGQELPCFKGLSGQGRWSEGDHSKGIGSIKQREPSLPGIRQHPEPNKSDGPCNYLIVC